MKSILFLINTLNTGGAEHILVNLVNSLSNRGLMVTVQTIFNEGNYKKSLNPNVTYKAGFKLYNGKKGAIFYRLLALMPSKLLYRSIVKEEYDYEIAFLEGLPTKIIAASTNKKAKKIAWVHIDLMESFGSNKVYKNFEENKKAYERFDKIACVSEDVKKKFIERFGNMNGKPETVYNIVLDDNIREKGLEPLYNFLHDCPIIVSCGRLCEQKGFDRLLRIHKRLLDEGVKQYLWIVGEGYLRTQFEEYIRDNNLHDTVTLWGFQQNPYKYMKNADLFVCSSIAEGFSTVVSEACILGTPIVSTDVAGAREPIDYPRCYKITENNEEALYFAIKELLSNQEELKKAKDYTVEASKSLKKDILLDNIIRFLGD